MVKTDPTAMLRQLKAKHPEAHPFTLAILLQVQTGIVITGQQAKQLLGRHGG